MSWKYVYYLLLGYPYLVSDLNIKLKWKQSSIKQLSGEWEGQTSRAEKENENTAIKIGKLLKNEKLVK